MNPRRSRSALLLTALTWLATAPACAGDEGYDEGTERPRKGPMQHELSVQSAAELLAREPEVVVLDVRAADDFAAGHIAGARNVDYQSAEFAAQVKQLDRAGKYLVYCGSGRISAAAFAQLHDFGFPEIYHLEGGFLAWQDAGQPVVQ